MVVFDASTLILLTRIELIERFIADFKGSVFVSESVKAEVLVTDKEETPFIEKLLKEGKIKVIRGNKTHFKEKLMADFNLGEGETDAIVYALNKKNAVVATDDRNAIKACKLLHVEFITALTVLVRANEKGILDKETALLKLEKLRTIGRYSDDILEDAMKHIKGGR